MVDESFEKNLLGGIQHSISIIHKLFKRTNSVVTPSEGAMRVWDNKSFVIKWI